MGVYQQPSIIDPEDFNTTVQKIRGFFLEKGFVEAHCQHLLSILAACEDPTTIASFNYSGQTWPLPQTSQMWLEHFLLKKPSLKGLFSISTSYRNEPNPIPGRHDLRFPMAEFETHGTVEDLIQLEKELLVYLGFDPKEFLEMEYRHLAEMYHPEEKEPELTGVDETKIGESLSKTFFLKNFPLYTSPFWNMKKEDNAAKKVDVILYGIETIGSAERSCDKEEMRHLFHTISEGHYANTLYAQFGRDRVEKELEDFLSFEFFPRVGGGIGMTRMIRAMKLLAEEKSR